MTVHGRGGQINPAFAPAEVLAGMPDIDLQGAQQFVEERQQTHPADMTALMLPNGQMVNLQGGGGVFSIRSRATLENGAWTQIEATVSVGTDTRGRPFRILRWRENIEDQ
jgi:general secretion pathway protein K